MSDAVVGESGQTPATPGPMSEREWKELAALLQAHYTAIESEPFAHEQWWSEWTQARLESAP
jgi:hypothetical protein